MFNTLKLKQTQRVSLVVKDHVIRFLDSKQPDVNSVRAVGERYLPEGVIREGKIADPDEFQVILEECVGAWGIKGKRVQFLVPDSFVVVRKIQIPGDIQTDEIKGYFYLEMGSSIHLPFEDPVFDYALLDEKKDYKELLLFAAPENIVLDFSQAMERAKLKPVAADISPLAAYRLYDQLGQAQAQEHLMIIQFDVQTVNISIFAEDKILFMRHLKMDIDWGGWKKDMDADGQIRLTWNGNEDFLLGEMQSMISELERVMNFYRFSMNQGKESITRILLMGDHPKMSEVEKMMREAFDIPLLTFAGQAYSTMKGEAIPAQHLLSLGLSLKEVD